MYQELTTTTYQIYFILITLEYFLLDYTHNAEIKLIQVYLIVDYINQVKISKELINQIKIGYYICSLVILEVKISKV